MHSDFGFDVFQGDHTLFRGNVFYDVKYFGNIKNSRSGTHDLIFRNNTFCHSSGWAGIIWDKNSGGTFSRVVWQDNVFCETKGRAIEWNGDYDKTIWDEYGNVYWHSQRPPQPTTGSNGSSVEMDPKFAGMPDNFTITAPALVGEGAKWPTLTSTPSTRQLGARLEATFNPGFPLMNMPQTLRLWATVFGLMACTTTALAEAPRPGVVSHVLVLSDKCEDVSSPEAWKKTYIKDGMTDQEKAIAIWKTVVKYRHQENPPGEGLQDANENHPEGNVHEPLKTFHVYGYGMCCCAAADIEGLARYIGMPARGRIINNHSVPEVWYDGAWHLLDASLMFYLQKPGPDGKPAAGPIASVDEMKADIMAWRKQHPEIGTDSDLKKFAMDGGWEKGPTLFASANLSREGAQYRFYDRHGINRAGWHG